MLRAPTLGLALVLGLTGCSEDPIDDPVPPGLAHAKACAERMAHPPADDGSSVAFHCATPILNVEDIHASRTFYEERLGFSTQWVWGDPVTFASVRRGHVELFMCQGCQGRSPTWVSVFIDGVDRLHEEYVARDVTIVTPPTDYEWGMREMVVEDPDGHRLRMAQAIR